jgi:hypothetical protein
MMHIERIDCFILNFYDGFFYRLFRTIRVTGSDHTKDRIAGYVSLLSEKSIFLKKPVHDYPESYSINRRAVIRSMKD